VLPKRDQRDQAKPLREYGEVVSNGANSERMTVGISLRVDGSRDDTRELKLEQSELSCIYDLPIKQRGRTDRCS
jgi:hypothetical protein